jgi:dihydropteroate synthase-like protein
MHYLFITGKLAAPALAEILPPVAQRAGFDYQIATLGISVAALMTPRWVVAHLQPPAGIDRIMIPGACTGNWEELKQATGITVEVGPADLRDLPDHFGQPVAPDYGAYDLEIIAELNHAPKLSWEELRAAARTLRQQGADLIDLGCIPGEPWIGVGAAVKALRDEGFRIAIDSFDATEVSAAVKAGAELVFSVNGSNRASAADWGCEVVAIPDAPAELESLDATVDFLTRRNVPHRLDPILEPIGMGLAASLARYFETRRRYPNHPMLMGVGNLTELTEVDSAGINVLLAGFCQELGIKSVLTTAVANWAQTSVIELDLARRLVHYAVARGVVPKKLEPRLLLLRERKLKTHGDAELQRLAQSLSDPNFRIHAEGGRLHVMNGNLHLTGADPFELFAQLARREALAPDHAFYLGYEMAKAVLALTLGKNYTQDQPLDFGFLTRPETSHREPERGGAA